MATELDTRPQDRPTRRKPFANFVKRLTHFKSGTDNQDKAAHGSKKLNGGTSAKGRKYNTISFGKNNPYPLSGQSRPQQQASQPSFSTTSQQQAENSSYASLPISGRPERDGPSHSNKSGAPTLATNAETLSSDAGNSKAATTTTGGVLSSMDGAGAGSTFSSPSHSTHSLATTLTTVQSTSQGGTPAMGTGHGQHLSTQNQPIGSTFSHQYPVSPAPSGTTASAIPRHVLSDANAPNTYNSATANNLLTDNASILTLASSSKRRRRSMDTDHASVRAMAPSSVWGGSRESLPLSVLSGNAGYPSAVGGGGLNTAERASVYSSSGLIRDRDSMAPALTDRNSYYAKQAGDAKSLRSIATNMKDDARSINNIDARSQYDAKSINNFETKSINDVASLRSGHARNDSTAGPGANLPTAATATRQLSSAAIASSSSRRNSDLHENEREGEEETDEAAKKVDEEQQK